MATKKEQVAFELENPNGLVTQANMVGHGNKTVDEELDDFGEKVGNTDEDGYYLCDSQGNVVMRYTGKGFDAAKLNPRLKKEELSQSNTDEDGWYLCDSEGNVVMKFTDKGLDAAKLSQRLKIEELAQSNTEEEGAYITDANGNFIFIADSNGVNMKVSTALLNYLKSKIEGGGGGGGTSYDEIGYPILDDTNPLAMLIKGRSRACLFKSWGIIGASFETGYMEVKLNGENATYTDTGYDWPTLFGQMNSVTVGNFALAGRPLRYWLTASAGFGKMQAADPMEAYVVNMSSNDADTSRYDEPVGDITTDIDYNDPDNNAATWVGCLATIIQKLRIKSPRCYIFMATMRRTAYWSPVQRSIQLCQALRDVCTCFDHVYLIDMDIYGINWSNADVKKAYLMGSHPTRAGHVYLADAFNTYIDWLIFKNPIGMRDASFVGTNYQDRNDYSQ